MGLRPGELLIDEETLTKPAVRDKVFVPVIDGELKGHGAVPRDYSTHPPEMFDPPAEIPIVPRSEWSARVKEMEEKGSRISDILLDRGVECLDQDGDGYCWIYSGGGCVTAVRAIGNQPYTRLNPHSAGAVIKQGRNEGGWCGLGAKFLREVGIAPESIWPRHSRDYRRYYTDACRAEMAKYRVTEEWVDLTRPVYDQNLTFDQLASALLGRNPCCADFNWWAHSVMACDLVEVEPGSFGIRIRNSWTESWGDRGFAVLRGSKAIPDGALAIRVVTASAAPAPKSPTRKKGGLK